MPATARREVNTIRIISAVLVALFVGAILVAGCGGKKKAGEGLAQGKSPEEMQSHVKSGGTGSGAPPAGKTGQ